MSDDFEIVICNADDCQSNAFFVGRFDDGTVELRCTVCGNLMWGKHQDIVDLSEETGNASPDEAAEVG